MPFTLTTVYPSYAHLQAVIGFDALQGTLVIRDPTEPTHGEFVEQPFFEWSQANGPRGMLLVPAEEAHRVEGIALPDAELYDLLHAVQDALVDHRRDDAVALCERLASLAPEHRIALRGAALARQLRRQRHRSPRDGRGAAAPVPGRHSRCACTRPGC